MFWLRWVPPLERKLRSLRFRQALRPGNCHNYMRFFQLRCAVSVDGPRFARVLTRMPVRPVAVMCTACCCGTRWPRAVMGTVDRGPIIAAGSRCSDDRGGLPSIVGLTDMPSRVFTLASFRRPVSAVQAAAGLSQQSSCRVISAQPMRAIFVGRRDPHQLSAAWWRAAWRARDLVWRACC